MTMLLAINFGDYGVIAADKSATNEYGENLGNCYKKIYNTNIGIIAGAGNALIIHEIKDYIQSIKIKNNKDMKTKIFNKKEELLFSGHHLEYNYDISTYNDTGFVVLSKINNKIELSLDYPDFIKLYYPNNKSSSIDILKNDFVITVPNVYSRKYYNNSRELIRKLIKADRNKENEESVIKKVFEMMAKDSSQISTKCDIVFI